MNGIYLTLGPVQFQAFEIPETIDFGGLQRIAAHDLISGGRVVDVLGQKPLDIAFSGIFSGAEASSRAQALDAVRAAGAVVILAWDTYCFSVVLKEFQTAYKKPFWIEFHLACAVVNDAAQDTAILNGSITNLINADLAMAQIWGAQAGLGPGGVAVGDILAAQTTVEQTLSASGSALLGQAAAFTDAPDGMSGVAALTQMTGSAAGLAAAGLVGAYLGRAAQNVSLELL